MCRRTVQPATCRTLRRERRHTKILPSNYSNATRCATKPAMTTCGFLQAALLCKISIYLAEWQSTKIQPLFLQDEENAENREVETGPSLGPLANRLNCYPKSRAPPRRARRWPGFLMHANFHPKMMKSGHA